MAGYRELNPGLSGRHTEMLVSLGSQSMMVSRFSGVEFAVLNDDRTKRLVQDQKKLVPELSAMMPFGGGWYAPNLRQIEIELLNKPEYRDGREYAYFLSNMTYTSKACNRFISNYVALLYTAEEFQKFSYTMDEIHAEVFNSVKLDQFNKHSVYLNDMHMLFHEIARYLLQLDQQEHEGLADSENNPDHDRTTQSYKDRMPALIAHNAQIQHFLTHESHQDTCNVIFAFYDYMQSIISGGDFEVSVLIEILARLRIGPLLEHCLKF